MERRMYKQIQRDNRLWWITPEGLVPVVAGGDGEGDDDGGEGGGGDSGEGTTPKTYSKAELDGIVRKAIEKERKTFADYEDLKAKASRLDELQEQGRSETDKLRSQADKAIRERDAALTRAQETHVRSRIIQEAVKQNAVDPDAVAALLDRTELTVDGDQIEGLEEAVKALMAAKPYLSGKGGGARRAGADFGSGQQAPPVTKVTQAQHREWLRTGTLTPERAKLVEEALASGSYVAGS
jgi:hypothetical protein